MADEQGKTGDQGTQQQDQGAGKTGDQTQQQQDQGKGDQGSRDTQGDQGQGQGDGKGQQDAGKDGDKGKVGAPEKYEDFKAPEGLALDKALLETALPLFKEANLPQATAQKFVDFFAGYVKKADASSADAWKTTHEGWAKSLSEDKDIGGAKLDETKANVAKFRRTFGNDLFNKLIEDYHLTDHPEFMRTLSKAGADISDDKVKQAAQGGQQPARKSQAEIMYGS